MSQYSKQYFSKRFLRIYPELWIAVVLELVTILLFYNERIIPVGLSAFAVTQGTFLQFWTPDFLRGYGCGTPNGSLWTISIIVQFYIAIWFARKLLQNRKPFFWGLLFAVSVTVGWMSNYLQHFVPEIAYKLFCQTLVPYLWLFVLGVIACEYSDRVIPLLKKYWVVSLLLYILLRFPFCNVDISVCDYPLCSCILMMMAVIGLSYAFPSINIKKDISYGIYIYHMIVVNVMIQLRMVEKPYYLLLVIAVTVGLAIVSTWIVSKTTKIVQDYKVI